MSDTTQQQQGGDNAQQGEQGGWTDERRPDQPGQQPPADDQQQPPADDQQQPPADDQQQPPADEDETPAEGAQDKTADEDENEQQGNGNAEAAKYRRQRNEAREQADTYGRRLFTELVRSTGKLIDAEDMPYNAELLESPDDLAAAVDELTTAKPHLKARQFENLGQHQRSRPAGASLGDILRSHA